MALTTIPRRFTESNPELADLPIQEFGFYESSPKGLEEKSIYLYLISQGKLFTQILSIEGKPVTLLTETKILGAGVLRNLLVVPDTPRVYVLDEKDCLYLRIPESEFFLLERNVSSVCFMKKFNPLMIQYRDHHRRDLPSLYELSIAGKILLIRDLWQNQFARPDATNGFGKIFVVGGCLLGSINYKTTKSPTHYSTTYVFPGEIQEVIDKGEVMPEVIIGRKVYVYLPRSAVQPGVDKLTSKGSVGIGFCLLENLEGDTYIEKSKKV
jgi:hypothetical protein